MAALPEMVAVPVPAMVRFVPSGLTMLTVKALPAGAEAVSRSSSKFTVRVAPSTRAQRKPGGDGWAATTLLAWATSPGCDGEPPVHPMTRMSYAMPGSRPVIVWLRVAAEMSVPPGNPPTAAFRWRTFHELAAGPEVAGVQCNVIWPPPGPGTA